MKHWTKEKVLEFILQNPESPSVEYLRPFDPQDPDLNQRICQKAEWSLLSMANLNGGLIFIGVDERQPGHKLAPFKANCGEQCLRQILDDLGSKVKPVKPRFKIHPISLTKGKNPDTIFVIEVAKSSKKHYFVTDNGIFYPMRSGNEIAKLEIIAARNKDIVIDDDLYEFIAFLKTYILPMFPGSYLSKTVFSSPSQDIAALDEEHNRILVKPHKDYRMRLMLARPHMFTHEDKDIVKSILQEIYNANNIVSPEYRSSLRQAALEIALCKYISPENYSTIGQIINGLQAWGIRTYEGRSAAFGIKVNLQQEALIADGESISQVIGEDYFAVLSDGRMTLLETNARGQLIGHHSTHGKRVNATVLAPFQYARMANEAGPRQVVIVLTHHSELLIFINKELKFARRRGVWLHFNHQPIIKLIAAGSKHVSEELRTGIYETLLDLSFAKTGGTICICRKTSLRRLLEDRGISAEDTFGHEAQSAKSRFLQHIIQNRKFQDIPRGLRKELLSIDGATVVDNEGQFLCVGAIVKVRSGSPSGGRLAATQALSKYGPAFKVSSDGMISAYLRKEHKPAQHPAEQDITVHEKDPRQSSAESRFELLFAIA